MIEIGDYRIQLSDPMNWNLEKRGIGERGKVKGLEIWKPLGYYHSFDKTIFALTEILIKDGFDDCESLEEVKDLIIDAKQAILEELDAMRESKNGTV